MAVDFALFLSPDGIALAQRQREGHWAFLGETRLDVPDLGHRLSLLRKAGEARAGVDFATLLVLPEDQILYTDLTIDPNSPDLRAAVGRGLDGRTPYALGELAFDYRAVAPDRVQVAAVAQTTLTEAIDFARSAGFNGVGFTATPPEAYFPGAPIFEVADGVGRADLPLSGIPFGPDTWKDTAEHAGPPAVPDLSEEPAGVFVREAAPARAPEPEHEPVPEPEPDAAPEQALAPFAAEFEAAPIPEADVAAAAADPADAPAEDRAAAREDDAPEEPAPEPEPGPEPEAEAGAEGDLPETAEADAPDADASDEAEILAAFRKYATGPDAETADPAEDADADVAPDSDIPEDAWEAAHAFEAGDLPKPEPEPEPAPAPDVPDMAASMSVEDHQAASFVTDDADPAPELDAPELDAPDLDSPAPPTFATQRRRDVDVSVPPEVPDDAAAPLTPEAPEDPDAAAPPDAEPSAAPSETKPPKTRKRRIARVPALFAGGGQPHEETSPVRADPVTPEPVLTRDRAEPEATADAEPDAAPVVDDPIPDMPIGLAERLRQRRETPDLDPEASGATFAFRRTPELPSPTRRIDMDDAMLTGGVLARRSDPAARPSLRTALVLTVVLVLVLALIAVWSALFLPESRVAQFFGRVAPDVDAPLIDPVVVSPDPTVEADPLAPALPDLAAPDFALGPDQGEADNAPPTEDLAALDPAPEVAPIPEAAPDPAQDLEPERPAIAARVPPPTPEEAAAEYADFGIWQLAPDPPAEPGRDFLIPEPGGTIQIAAIDPVVPAFDALALVDPGAPGAPRPLASPPPYAALINPEGLVDAVPEGVLTESGAFVVLGTPALPAQPRPGPVPAAAQDGDAPALTAAGGLSDAILAAFPPTIRPDNFAEELERQRLGGLTSEELSDRRPVTRPQSLQELAAAAREAAEADSDLAVSASPTPPARPEAVETAAAEAIARGPASSASTAALVAPEVEPQAPPTVEPDIPSNASVSRSATVENGINLREINLIGVRGAPDNRVALVRLASGRFVEVSVGDRLDGGRVAAIGDDSLQYVRGGRNITLEAPSG